jgi:hypothetical protein
LSTNPLDPAGLPDDQLHEANRLAHELARAVIAEDDYLDAAVDAGDHWEDIINSEEYSVIEARSARLMSEYKRIMDIP